MKVEFKKSFSKKFKKLDKVIQIKTDETINFFTKNPFDPALRNHALIGEYKGFRSIDITGDYRALFKEYPEGTYEFVDFIYI